MNKLEYFDKQKKLHFAIVIYNKRCEDSPSFIYAINHLNKLNLIVVDNSTIQTDNKDYCNERKISYISMNGNKGLAKAYNVVLEAIQGYTGYIIWADDDTLFPENFIAMVLDKIDENPKYNGVFLPIVNAGKCIFSPTVFTNNKIPKRVKNLSELENKRLSGINSGMIVNMDVYNHYYRYDERFFLDFIDHEFCLFCHLNNIPVVVLKNIKIDQNSFFESETDFNKIMKRRKFFRKDLLLYCSKNRISTVLAYKTVFNGDMATIFKTILPFKK